MSAKTMKGKQAILRYLEKTNTKNVRGAVLVSGTFFKTTKKKIAGFLSKLFDCSRIRLDVKDIAVIHGANDKSVSPDQATALAESLAAELIMVKNGGHLNGSSGWFKLPQCLSALQKMMG